MIFLNIILKLKKLLPDVSKVAKITDIKIFILNNFGYSVTVKTLCTQYSLQGSFLTTQIRLQIHKTRNCAMLGGIEYTYVECTTALDSQIIKFIKQIYEQFRTLTLNEYRNDEELKGSGYNRRSQNYFSPIR